MTKDINCRAAHQLFTSLLGLTFPGWTAVANAASAPLNFYVARHARELEVFLAGDGVDGQRKPWEDKVMGEDEAAVRQSNREYRIIALRRSTDHLGDVDRAKAEG